MDWLHAFILALVQGVTEFLPISSSGHLILVPKVLGWPDQGLAFDVAVHVGSLIAVVAYFRKEVVTLLHDWKLSIIRRETVGDSRLAWAVGIATIPAGLAGLFLGDFVETSLRSPFVIAMTTIGFGLMLWWSDALGARERSEHEMSWLDIILIGCAQALALVPGTSRSGITMTAALFLGLTRTAAARFSFLMSIPLILLAGGVKTVELLDSGETAAWGPILFGVVVAAVSAYIGIHFLLKLVEKAGMLPFVIYRLVLGTYLLFLFS